MPAMMGNQPMKNDYVSGLEDAIAKKTRPPMGPRRPPISMPAGRPPKGNVREQPLMSQKQMEKRFEKRLEERRPMRITKDKILGRKPRFLGSR